MSHTPPSTYRVVHSYRYIRIESKVTVTLAVCPIRCLNRLTLTYELMDSDSAYVCCVAQHHHHRKPNAGAAFVENGAWPVGKCRNFPSYIQTAYIESARGHVFADESILFGCHGRMCVYVYMCVYVRECEYL